MIYCYNALVYKWCLCPNATPQLSYTSPSIHSSRNQTSPFQTQGHAAVHKTNSTPLPPRRRTPSCRYLLERILQLIVLAHVMLPPPLSRNMLNHQLTHMTAHETANKPGVPEFRSDPQVLAAAHESVGFAAFGRRRDAVGVEVLLLAAGDGDEAVT